MITLSAPAKINLTLEVLARRSDGYHGVRSLMVPLNLADELSIEPSDRFIFRCDRPELDNEHNLAVAALRALGTLPQVRVELRKTIPVQGGLGGGSSDAGAVLRAAMNGAFGALEGRDWMKIARTLGSDVPFFLAGTGALVEGTGERITPVGALPSWHALIVKPPIDISTAGAYESLDRSERPQRPRQGSRSLMALEALQRGDFAAMERLLHNDFQEVITANSPQVGEALAALRAAGASNALLSGSGSCVFSLAPSREQIEAIGARLPLASSFSRYACAFAASSQWQQA